LARYFGISTAINSTEGIKLFKNLAQELLDTKNPATFNQAVMEFGAILCKPKNPDCLICPLQNSCKALQEKTVSKLPHKEKKVKVKNRFFNYLVIINPSSRVVLNQRKGKGIWRNLYQFPLIETSKEIDIKELTTNNKFRQTINTKISNISLFNEKPIIHKLTHQHLSVKFWVINVNEEIKNSISISNFEKYPVPILIHKFAQAYF